MGCSASVAAAAAPPPPPTRGRASPGSGSSSSYTSSGEDEEEPEDRRAREHHAAEVDMQQQQQQGDAVRVAAPAQLASALPARSVVSRPPPAVAAAAPAADREPAHIGLLDRYVRACSGGGKGAGVRLWLLLSPHLQAEYTAEGQEHSPAQPGEQWALEKNGWNWAVERGRFVGYEIVTFDGHMAVLHTTFDTGDRRQTTWVDTVWTRQQSDDVVKLLGVAAAGTPASPASVAAAGADLSAPLCITAVRG